MPTRGCSVTSITTLKPDRGIACITALYLDEWLVYIMLAIFDIHVALHCHLVTSVGEVQRLDAKSYMPGTF